MIQLDNNLSLGIEKDGSDIRLIVYQASTELVCRKSTLSGLKKILDDDNAHLFKGRLQLYRTGELIAVEVKKNAVGTVSLNDFSTLIA